MPLHYRSELECTEQVGSKLQKIDANRSIDRNPTGISHSRVFPIAFLRRTSSRVHLHGRVYGLTARTPTTRSSPTPTYTSSSSARARGHAIDATIFNGTNSDMHMRPTTSRDDQCMIRHGRRREVRPARGRSVPMHIPIERAAALPSPPPTRRRPDRTQSCPCWPPFRWWRRARSKATPGQHKRHERRVASSAVSIDLAYMRGGRSSCYVQSKMPGSATVAASCSGEA